LRSSLCWAVDSRRGLPGACVAVSEVVVTVWVLAVALDAVLRAVAADGVGVGGRDMAMSMGGSGREVRGCRACREAVG
jgi:hypothetical protein